MRFRNLSGMEVVCRVSYEDDPGASVMVVQSPVAAGGVGYWWPPKPNRRYAVEARPAARNGNGSNGSGSNGGGESGVRGAAAQSVSESWPAIAIAIGGVYTWDGTSLHVST